LSHGSLHSAQMPIPVQYAHRYLYHFTHIDNLPGILKSGFLCKNHAGFPATGCRSVAAEGIQARRSEMEVPCGPFGVVHDYVPLYFGTVSPMLLAVVQKKNVDQMDILYFEFPISLIERDDVVFTDASANTNMPPEFFSDPNDLSKLNWAEIDSRKWSSADEALRHQRMAEALVHRKLKVTDAARVVVWNDDTKARVQRIVDAAGAKFPPIDFQSPQRPHWFLAFFSTDRARASLVKGPREIALEFRRACDEIVASLDGCRDGGFESPKALLKALRADFRALPHTSELVGLKSANGIHKQTVDMHTVEVVRRLRNLPEFAALPTDAQDRTELAAFLHDIGKGPASRWKSNSGLQKVDPDHPVGAMPMMVEIFTKHVKKVSAVNARFIVKLVCYHDLVGEVLGKGRDERQIVNVADSKLDLDALFAIGKADATSLVEWWWDDNNADALYTRCVAGLEARAEAKATTND
jgi:hypothetical protein